MKLKTFSKQTSKILLLKVITSRIAWLLVTIHWFLVIYGFYKTGSIDVTQIDPRTEWYLIGIVLFINFPATIIATLFTMPFYFVGQYYSQKILYVFIIVFWTIEWLLIGNVIRALIDEFRPNKRNDLN